MIYRGDSKLSRNTLAANTCHRYALLNYLIHSIINKVVFGNIIIWSN